MKRETLRLDESLHEKSLKDAQYILGLVQFSGLAGISPTVHE